MRGIGGESLSQRERVPRSGGGGGQKEKNLRKIYGTPHPARWCRPPSPVGRGIRPKHFPFSHTHLPRTSVRCWGRSRHETAAVLSLSSHAHPIPRVPSDPAATTHRKLSTVRSPS